MLSAQVSKTMVSQGTFCDYLIIHIHHIFIKRLSLISNHDNQTSRFKDPDKYSWDIDGRFLFVCHDRLLSYHEHRIMEIYSFAAGCSNTYALRKTALPVDFDFVLHITLSPSFHISIHSVSPGYTGCVKRTLTALNRDSSLSQ